MSDLLRANPRLSAPPPIVRVPIARAAGALLVFTGFLSPLVAVTVDRGASLVLSLIGVAVGLAGLVMIGSRGKIPAWGLPAVPWLVTALGCAHGYLAAPAAEGAATLLVCATLLGGLVLPRSIAVFQAAVAVTGYAIPALVAEPAGGVLRVGYLAAGCLIALLLAVPLGQVVSQLLEELAERQRDDELTGLLNARGFEEVLVHELAVCQRSGRPVALLTVGLDGFIEINDLDGRAAGAEVLRETAEVLRTQLRDSDVLARTAAGEFSIVLPACGDEDALRRAEHIRSLIERTAVDWKTPVTVTIGVAVAPQHGQAADDLAGAAGVALAEARAGGRNRVEIATGGLTGSGFRTLGEEVFPAG